MSPKFSGKKVQFNVKTVEFSALPRKFKNERNFPRVNFFFSMQSMVLSYQESSLPEAELDMVFRKVLVQLDSGC